MRNPVSPTPVPPPGVVEIPEFPGYFASPEGRIWSQFSDLWLKMNPSAHGYLHVNVYVSGRQYRRSVHGLVARAFHGPRPEGLVARHLDGDQGNNRASNLAYGTYSENQLDSVAHGTHWLARRDRCKNDHLYTEQSTGTRPDGSRVCRTCDATRQRAHKARKASA